MIFTPSIKQESQIFCDQEDGVALAPDLEMCQDLF